MLPEREEHAAWEVDAHTGEEVVRDAIDDEYDALNRPTLITYADGSTVVFTYDQGVNGIGHLTGMVDSSGSTHWQYDNNGRVIQKSTTVGAMSLSTSYNYDNTGQLVSIGLPSGTTQLAYTWSNGEVIGLSAMHPATGVSTALLIFNVVHQPFLGLKSWTLGNGETTGRTFDLNGRVIADPVESVVYDTASQIKGRSSSALNVIADVQSFDYDALGRINSYSGANGTMSYNYDASGNRIAQGVSGVQNISSTDSTSNKVTGITPPLAVAGNPLSFVDPFGLALTEEQQEALADAAIDWWNAQVPYVPAVQPSRERIAPAPSRAYIIKLASTSAE